MSKGPAFRLQIKVDGVRMEWAIAYESDRFPGLYDLKLIEMDEGGQYPKMSALKALRMATEKDENGRRRAWLSMASVRPGKNGAGARERQKANRDDGEGGGGDDFGSIPFMRVDSRMP